MIAVLVVPGITFAQTQSVADLQTELQNLLAEVASLEAQINAQGGSVPAWCYNFTSNLSIGMSGPAVNALQTALGKDGESVTTNGTFDDRTAAAVTAFQEKYRNDVLSPYGLSNGTGYAGKSTRAKLNALFGCSSSAVANASSSGTGTNEGSYSVTGENANAGEGENVSTGENANTGDGQSESQSQSQSGTESEGEGAISAPQSASTVTITSPAAGQTYTFGGIMNIQWTPASSGIGEIDLVPADGSWPTHGAVIYGLKVYGYPTNYSGSFSYSIQAYPYYQIPAGSYYLKLYDANDALVGQSGTFTLSAPAPAITNVTSAGATPTPGSNEMLIGTNLPTSDATIVIDPGSTSALTIVPSGYNVGGGGNMTFFLPSTVGIGSHTIEIEEAGGTVSNVYAFTVVAGAVSFLPSATISAGPSVISNGQSATIAWQSTGATSCTLSGTNGYNDNGPWSQSGLPVSGSKVITPYPSSTTDYTAQYQIVCTDSTGNGATATTTVTVNRKG